MSIDIIGIMTDLDNPVSTPIKGYHVNATEPVPEWEQHRVNPKNPRRVFWGVDPVCYSFPDEATYRKEYKSAFGEDEAAE